MFAKPCTCKQTTGVTQRGHEDKHDGMCHRMTVERQRHDQAGGKQRNVQNGEHGDCHMAQSAVAHITLALAAIATSSKEASTQTVIATI